MTSVRSLVLILDNVRSAYNVGSIWRSAAAFGVSELALIGITPHPKIEDDKRLPHTIAKAEKMITKTALGAEKDVPFQYFHIIDDAIAYFIRQNYKIYALEQTKSSVDIKSFKPQFPCVVIVGNEVSGISDSVSKKVDAVVEIPLPGKKESLNVAVAAGVALYQLSR